MDTWRDRIAHAATPWGWKERNFWAFVVVTVALVVVVIMQQFLLADGVSYVIATLNSIVVCGALLFGLRNSFRQRAKRRQPN